MSAIRVPRSLSFFVLCLTVVSTTAKSGLTAEELARSDARILFLGDSITAAGQYVNDIETAVLLRQGGQEVPQIVALGLGSETASGLSEKSHPFPRPTVHERLDRVLKAVQPTVVVACYGINDGIYQPFSKERFAAYQDGIRVLIQKVHDAGARIVLLTPPPYAGKLSEAPAPQGNSEYDYRVPFPAYDSVMARYADWIMTLNTEDRVDTIDIRTPMLAAIEASYDKDPIHPNAHGHRVMATAVLANWDKVMPDGEPIDLAKVAEDNRWSALHLLVSQRRKVYDGKLLWEIGHQRPGNAPEITLEEAQTQAKEIDRQIAALLGE
ncbi:MAG: SGNH/GDSL hydrolase family protein [Planctomycetaceae bacterium]|nr:SGNH/GDSL hydrolase family protein [Planctomycetaceae bacterium]